MERKTTKTVKVTYVYCDLCDAKLTGTTHSNCAVCQRDICPACNVGPEGICQSCKEVQIEHAGPVAKLREKHRIEMNQAKTALAELEENHQITERELDERWRQIAIEKATGNKEAPDQ